MIAVLGPTPCSTCSRPVWWDRTHWREGVSIHACEREATPSAYRTDYCRMCGGAITARVGDEDSIATAVYRHTMTDAHIAARLGGVA